MDKFKKGMKRLLKDKSIKIIIIVFIAIIALFAVVSYSNKAKRAKYAADGQDPIKVDESGNITGENVTGLREEQLAAGGYYILHNDRFYPLFNTYMPNFSLKDEITGSSTSRVLMTTINAGKKIPTLYLGNNDSLVYFNPKNLKSFSILERFTDEGISVGVYSFKYNPTNGYYYFSVNPEDEISSISPASSAAQLLDGVVKKEDEDDKKDRNEEEEDEAALFFTMTDIGGVKMARDQIKSTGIIKNLEPGASYETSIYNGTNYNRYVMKADTWYFTGLEAYAISDVPLGKRSFQTITIPEYMKDGYYAVDNKGLFRLVRGTSWNTNMDLSSRLLAVNQTENKNSVSEQTLKTSLYFEPALTTARYSENPELNLYKTKDPSAFGYKPETGKTEQQTIDYERHDGEIPQKLGDSDSTSKPADNNSSNNNREESENKTSATSSSSSSQEIETSATSAGSSGENSATSSQETNERRTRE